MIDAREAEAVAIIRATLADTLAAGLDDAGVTAVRIADLALDSLGKFELILELEKAYDCALDEVAIADCRTLGDLVRLVLRSTG